MCTTALNRSNELTHFTRAHRFLSYHILLYLILIFVLCLRSLIMDGQDFLDVQQHSLFIFYFHVMLTYLCILRKDLCPSPRHKKVCGQVTFEVSVKSFYCLIYTQMSSLFLEIFFLKGCSKASSIFFKSSDIWGKCETGHFL